MTLSLTLTPDQTATLLKLDAQLRAELEQHAFPTHLTLDIFRSELTKVLDQQPGFFEIWEKAATSSQELCLASSGTAVRNLPWHLALLDGNRLFAMAKSSALPDPHMPTNCLPLKILVMVAAPEGAVALDYEDEELRLLRAIEPMMAKGLAQVHFTDDGSLESLERALSENHYHVLHFSGHGMYKDGIGYLLTEDEATGQPKQVNARDFNALLARMDERKKRPELVILSACQSAQGEQAGDLQGVADTLHAGGVPAVIAMSASVLDSCATEFTTALYEQLAKDAPLSVAFREAVFVLKKYETDDRDMQRLRQSRETGQWLIPQLLVSKNVRGLADTTKPHQTLDFRDARFVAGQEMLNLRGTDRKKYGYVFLGRRKERRQALALLRNPDHPWVLLRGQGGVGKTSLAEHLAVRLLAANPTYKVFMHSEKAPPLESLLNKMLEYLTKGKKQLKRKLEYDELKTWEEQFLFLTGHIEEFCNPIFVFDNVEAFQSSQGGTWLPERVDVLGALQILWRFTAFPVIFTGRYPMPEFPNLPVCDLNAVGFNEFRKKCWQLPFGKKLADRMDADRLRELLTKREGAAAATFDDVLRLLHRCFGGNYRALEFFDELFAEKPDDIFATLGRLEELEAKLRDTRDKQGVLARMSENLVFSELLALLTPAQAEALALLTRFRIPVLPMALAMQRDNRDFGTELNRLADLTLVERGLGTDGQTRFFVMPIVQDLLADNNFLKVHFLEKIAGDYHDYVVENKLSADSLTDLDQAFKWYCAALAVEEVNEVGGRLCQFYYEVGQFRLSQEYGLHTEKIAGGQTTGKIWNALGLVHWVFGQLDEAVMYLEKALSFSRDSNNQQGESAALNNIGLIEKDRANFPKALSYFQQGLALCQKVSNKYGEGQCLSNIGQIYQAYGDYDKAFEMFKQSLIVSQEIGNRKIEGQSINNISQLHQARGEYELALNGFRRCLKIWQEIGDKLDEGRTLNNIGQIYEVQKEYDQALKVFQQSLEISQEVGDRQGESTTLNNISLIYMTFGNYDKALEFSLKDLKICQEGGNRAGMSTTLHTIASIYFMKKDFEEYIEYEKTSFQIALETGFIEGIYYAGQDLGFFLCQSGDVRAGLEILQLALEAGRKVGYPNVGQVEDIIQHFSKAK